VAAAAAAAARGRERGEDPWPEVEEERVVEQEATPSRFARAAQHNIAAT